MPLPHLTEGGCGSGSWLAENGGLKLWGLASVFCHPWIVWPGRPHDEVDAEMVMADDSTKITAFSAATAVSFFAESALIFIEGLDSDTQTVYAEGFELGEFFCRDVVRIRLDRDFCIGCEFEIPVQ